MKKFKYLGLEATVVDDRIEVRCCAPPAIFFRDQVNRVLDAVNSLKVIAHRDGALVYNLYNPPQPTRAGFHAIERNIKAKISGHPWPATANLAITMACQCDCVHCSAEPFRDHSRRELATDEIKSVVRKATDMGCTLVIFVGGEPLIHKDIYELIARVDPDKAVAMIFTNGWLLTADNVKRLADAGLYSMYISIDSSDPDEHDRLRRLPGAFQRAVDGGKRALDAGLLVGLSTYATHDRLAAGKVEALLQFGQREGFNEVTVFDCIPSGRFLKRSDLILSDEDKATIIELTRRYHAMDHPMGVVAQAIVNSPLGAGCFGALSEFYMPPTATSSPATSTPSPSATSSNSRLRLSGRKWSRIPTSTASTRPAGCRLPRIAPSTSISSPTALRCRSRSKTSSATGPRRGPPVQPDPSPGPPLCLDLSARLPARPFPSQNDRVRCPLFLKKCL